MKGKVKIIIAIFLFLLLIIFGVWLGLGQKDHWDDLLKWAKCRSNNNNC